MATTATAELASRQHTSATTRDTGTPTGSVLVNPIDHANELYQNLTETVTGVDRAPAADSDTLRLPRQRERTTRNQNSDNAYGNLSIEDIAELDARVINTRPDKDVSRKRTASSITDALDSSVVTRSHTKRARRSHSSSSYNDESTNQSNDDDDVPLQPVVRVWANPSLSGADWPRLA
jgi:hypothetical protein